MNPRTRFKTSSGRRQWLGAAMTLVAGGLVRPVLGQPVSAAAEEAKAPPLPALGSILAVPPVDLIGGGRFDPGQARGKPLPHYAVLEEGGEDHARVFRASCTLADPALSTQGEGSSRRAAEQQAAEAALQAIEG